MNRRIMNFLDLIEIIRMCRETGCSSIKINLYQSPEIYTAQNPKDTEAITCDDSVYVQFIERCKQLLKNINFTGYHCKAAILTTRFTVFFPTPFKFADTAIKGLNPQRHCRLPWTLGTFNARGNYNFCCGTSIEPEINNIFIHGEDIINSEKARRIRKCLINPKERLAPECAKCVYLSGSYISDL